MPAIDKLNLIRRFCIDQMAKATDKLKFVGLVQAVKTSTIGVTADLGISAGQ